MKKLSVLLALAMLLTCCLCFAACDPAPNDGDSTADSTEPVGDAAGKGNAVAASLAEIAAAVEPITHFNDKTSELLYMADDADMDMLILVYGLVDIPAMDHVTDYVISMPTDYANTFAVFLFDDGMTQADYDEAKETMIDIYMRSRASALQMYMPEEYEIMAWAVDHPELVWRQYDNALVLIVDQAEEPAAAWEAFEAAALK